MLETNFKTYTSLDYLGIAIANAKGLDKLNFEDRLAWFYSSIYEKDFKPMSDKEIRNYAFDSELNAEEPNNLFAGLIALRNHQNGLPSGYKVSLDAVCSGLQIMSALTGCIEGLNLTGCIENERKDAYMDIYNTFLEIFNEPSNKTRPDIKQAVMTYYYGSTAVPKKIFGDTEKELQSFYDAISIRTAGAKQLRDLWVNSWNSNATHHTIIMPDGFRAILPTVVKNYHTFRFQGNDITYQLKELGTLEQSVSNCPNAIHAIDGMIVREMHRRANFDYEKVFKCLKSLKRITSTHNPHYSSNILQKEGTLGELVYMYNETGFTSVRTIDYLNNTSDAELLPKSMRIKLIDILELLLKQDTFDLCTVHDCFQSLPSKGNYVRYWYKELIADITDSQLINWIDKQINPNHTPISPIKDIRKQLSTMVRNSNYALC